eukprot:410378-Rhodomonas_salina.1
MPRQPPAHPPSVTGSGRRQSSACTPLHQSLAGSSAPDRRASPCSERAPRRGSGDSGSGHIRA